MSLPITSRQMFLYGYEVTDNNSSLDFKANPLDTPPRAATLRIGYYSLTGLLEEVVRALTSLDPNNTYTATADRTMAGGTQNRITISSSNTYFQMLFSSGPRASSNCAALLGFTPTDKTGATSYTGSFSTGLALLPTRVGYNYLGPEFMRKVFGAVNISTSGLKEAIVYNIQQFFQMEFKYEPQTKVINEWVPFLEWAIQQRGLEFTPDISDPTVVLDCTLESTEDDGKGLGYRMNEMLPDFPKFFRTGTLKFRRTL